MYRTLRASATLALFAALAHRAPSLRGEPASPLVTAQAGNLPIILSSPHGGKQPVPGVPERTVGGAGKFVKLRDGDTDILAFKLADEIERVMGARPHLVVARFHRKFIDANRPVAGAFESEAARTHYDAYHAALKSACHDVRQRWGAGILIDIHGQGVDDEAIFRGTVNGKTVTGLITKFGKRAISGPESIAGQLAARGYKILPPCDDPGARETQFVGGHILVTHATPDSGIDGIQLEFGRKFRKADGIGPTARDIAQAITAFANAFLPAHAPAPAGPAGQW